MNKIEIMKRYNKEDKEIKEYLDMITDYLLEKNGDIYGEYVLSLDLLVYNLRILMKAMSDMDDKGLDTIDRYRGAKKNAALQAFMSSQNYIHRILNTFGFTPAGKAKIKNVNTAQDIQKYLEELTQ